MNKIEHLNSLDQINVLSDPKRLAILEVLMVKPRTVSQIGRKLGEYPAGIRYHIKKLEQSNLVVLNEVKISPGFTEKYYSAKAQAYLLQRIILPLSDKKNIIFMGSHDLAFEKLTSGFENIFPDIHIFNLPVGSLDGLIAVRQGAAHISGCHLLDRESDQYNYPFIKHIFPDQTMNMITLAHRVQGLIFSGGNPKKVTGLDDLAREDISFINRNRGSGTRIWLDNKLNEMDLDPSQINGYTQELNSHTAITQTIKNGSADLGIGLIAAAVIDNLDFIPLFEEQYDLVVPDNLFEDKEFFSFLDFLNSADFRQEINSLEGYKTQKTGTLMSVKSNFITHVGGINP